MTAFVAERLFNLAGFRTECSQLLATVECSPDLNSARAALLAYVQHLSADLRARNRRCRVHELARSRDCARALTNTFFERSEEKAGFSVVQAIWDLARGVEREDLKPGFFAELIKWTRGLEVRSDFHFIASTSLPMELDDRQAARLRS